MIDRILAADPFLFYQRAISILKAILGCFTKIEYFDSRKLENIQYRNCHNCMPIEDIYLLLDAIDVRKIQNILHS